MTFSGWLYTPLHLDRGGMALNKLLQQTSNTSAIKTSLQRRVGQKSPQKYKRLIVSYHKHLMAAADAKDSISVLFKGPIMVSQSKRCGLESCINI